MSPLLHVLAALAAGGMRTPPMVVDPVLVYNGDRLPLGAIESAADGIMELDGARFGIMVRDFADGDEMARGDGGVFDTGGSAVALFACGLETGGGSAVGDWLEEEGLGRSAIAGDGTLISDPADVMAMLELIDGRLLMPSVRAALGDPLQGSRFETDAESTGIRLYGFRTVREGPAGAGCTAVIAAMPGGRRAGIVLMADNLCCAAKVDLAFLVLLQSLAGEQPGE
jgi:hypothetical protein